MSEIIIHNGETSTGLVAGSGDIIIIEAGGTLVDGVINDGGVLSATYGAVAENLTAATGATVELTGRSEERRVGKECRLLCRSRWSPYH